MFQATGDLPRAQRFHEQALAIRRRALGNDHPDTAQSLDNLGYLFLTMADLDEAQRYP